MIFKHEKLHNVTSHYGQTNLKFKIGEDFIDTFFQNKLVKFKIGEISMHSGVNIKSFNYFVKALRQFLRHIHLTYYSVYLLSHICLLR